MEDAQKLIEKYIKLKNEIKKLETEQDFIKSQLKIIFERDGVEIIECEEGKAYFQTRNSESIDRFKGYELFGEKFNQCLRNKQSKFLMIKEINKDD